MNFTAEQTGYDQAELVEDTEELLPEIALEATLLLDCFWGERVLRSLVSPGALFPSPSRLSLIHI